MSFVAETCYLNLQLSVRLDVIQIMGPVQFLVNACEFSHLSDLFSSTISTTVVY